jgi:hypothetical protein
VPTTSPAAIEMSAGDANGSSVRNAAPPLDCECLHAAAAELRSENLGLAVAVEIGR